MNLLDAVSLVLEESGASLHVSEITKRILTEKPWETSVEAPEETVGARIYSDINRNVDASRFILHTS